MSTVAALAIYTPFFVITIVILVIELFRGFKRHEDYLFTVLCLCIALWFASDVLTLLINDYGILRFLYNFKLIFVGFVPPFLLLFVLRFYKVQLGARERTVRLLLFTVPTINILVVLTSGFHHWMVDLILISLSPQREFLILWGPWFWVHTVQSYVVSVIIITAVILRHFRMPRFYRMPSTLMSVGILITLLGNVITLLQLFPPTIDPTLITCSLSLILFDLAIINNNKSKFVHFSHKRIYHYLEQYILILDEAQRVLEFNPVAESWFSSQGLSLKDVSFPALLEGLRQKQGATEKTAEDGRGTNFYLLNRDFPVVLNLRLHEITDAHGDIIGFIAVFSDITHTWALIEQLEEKAGMDSLTGLPNHRSYVGAKDRLDSKENLPLSVVVCDVNYLKQVNDTLGHTYGDLMLKVIARVLEKAFSQQFFVARTGGDEFICLLPNTTLEEAQQKTAAVGKSLASLDQYPFRLSLAMGVATKVSDQENLDELIALADEKMYENKKRIKETEQKKEMQIGAAREMKLDPGLGHAP